MMAPAPQAERVLWERNNIPWLPPNSTMQCIVTQKLPALELITSVHGLPFDGDNTITIIHEERGRDIIGGHREGNETPEEVLGRESLEEGCIVVEKPRLVAVLKITLNGPKPDDYMYPYPVSYQAFYRAEVARVEPFVQRFETTGREILTPERALRHPWIAQNRELYELLSRS